MLYRQNHHHDNILGWFYGYIGTLAQPFRTYYCTIHADWNMTITTACTVPQWDAFATDDLGALPGQKVWREDVRVEETVTADKEISRFCCLGNMAAGNLKIHCRKTESWLLPSESESRFASSSNAPTKLKLGQVHLGYQAVTGPRE